MRTVSKDQTDKHRYDDMLDIDRPVSKNHRHMPTSNRAAQFIPYDALVGFKDSIHETERTTMNRIELSEDEKQQVNDVLNQLLSQIKSHPKVQMTYFLRDSFKYGGSYEQIIEQVKKIELGKIYFLDQIVVDIEDVIRIEII